jgi:hypothetical protein
MTDTGKWSKWSRLSPKAVHVRWRRRGVVGDSRERSGEVGDGREWLEMAGNSRRWPGTARITGKTIRP